MQLGIHRNRVAMLPRGMQRSEPDHMMQPLLEVRARTSQFVLGETRYRAHFEHSSH